MTKKVQIISLIICFFALFVHGQNKINLVTIGFDITWKNQPLILNKTYQSASDLLEITTVKFYVSAIELLFEDKSTFMQKDSYHLVDIEDDLSLNIPIHLKTDKAISKIRFNIGIDSLASVSGALSGDLDPTKGMYWAWQSGFINMKIEGKSDSCKTRKNAFQFHIGGYLMPNYAMRKIEIQVMPTQIVDDKIAINVDLSKLFDAIDLVKTNTIVVPGHNAMLIADLSTKLFSIK